MNVTIYKTDFVDIEKEALFLCNYFDFVTVIFNDCTGKWHKFIYSRSEIKYLLF